MTEASSHLYTFFGRIIPERVPLSIEIPKARASAPDLGLEFTLHTFIHHSQIICTLTTENSAVDIETLRNLVDSSIRSVVDVIGYQNGLSYDLEISSAAWGNDQKFIFGINIPILVERRKSFNNSLSTDLLISVGSDPAAQFVLADFREAMRIPQGTGFFCYRAVEAIMQSMKISSNENEPSVSWPRLRETLRISKDTLLWLKNHADFPRHGKPSSISNDDRAKIFKITDEIIERYLKYLVLGRLPVSEKDYPDVL